VVTIAELCQTCVSGRTKSQSTGCWWVFRGLIESMSQSMTLHHLAGYVYRSLTRKGHVLIYVMSLLGKVMRINFCGGLLSTTINSTIFTHKSKENQILRKDFRISDFPHRLVNLLKVFRDRQYRYLNYSHRSGTASKTPYRRGITPFQYTRPRQSWRKKWRSNVT
jgi:hypothetical protein